VAPALGVQGSGPAFEFGRAGGNAIGAAAGLGAATKPTQGQVNMLVGRGAPGFDLKKGKEIAEFIRKNSETGSDYSIANLAAKRGQVYDPGARAVLQYVDTSGWEIDPKKLEGLRQGSRYDFGEIFKNNPGKGQLPNYVLGTRVGTTNDLGGASYNPSMNEIKLSQQSVGLGTDGKVERFDRLGQPVAVDAQGLPQVFRNHILHEGQHAVQEALGLTPGINPRYTDAVDNLMQGHMNVRERALLTKAGQRAIAGKPRMPDRFVIGSPRLRAAFRDSEASIGSNGVKSYEADIGEQIARHAETVGMEGVPTRGLNVFQPPDTLLDPTLRGVPLAMKTFLTDAKARHPELFKRLLNTYPDLREFGTSDRRFQEMLGSRPFLGLPGEPSPLRKQQLLRRAPPTSLPPVEAPPQQALSVSPPPSRDLTFIHAGSDFDTPDARMFGRGEPGSLRPLGQGLYGYLARDQDEAMRAVEAARAYLKYAPGDKKAIHGFKIPAGQGQVDFRGKVWDDTLLTPEMLKVRDQSRAANAIPPGPERLAAFAALRNGPRHDGPFNLATEYLSGLNVIEAATSRLDLLKRVGKWSPELTNEEIVRQLWNPQP